MLVKSFSVVFAVIAAFLVSIGANSTAKSSKLKTSLLIALSGFIDLLADFLLPEPIAVLGYVVLLIIAHKFVFKVNLTTCNNAKTTESNYSRMMRDYAYQHNMPEQLRIAGANTRIKPGETHLRLGKNTRLQENLVKRARRAS